MGKNKQKSKLTKLKGGGGGGGGGGQGMKGTHKAFKVNTHKATKAKQKAKAVTTNLKRLNVQNRQQVNQSDDVFAQLQKDMKMTHKDTQKSVTSKKPDNSQKTAAAATTTHAPPNMEEATKLMESL
ncbi:uncharacterized protein [Amphiura filiformis]|uniref:uncharacterized protein n=1 Tax=Amphiura filiformis TaxID=82378 RepID=UPI003B2265CF